MRASAESDSSECQLVDQSQDAAYAPNKWELQQKIAKARWAETRFKGVNDENFNLASRHRRRRMSGRYRCLDCAIASRARIFQGSKECHGPGWSPQRSVPSVFGLNYLIGMSKCAADGDTAPLSPSRCKWRLHAAEQRSDLSVPNWTQASDEKVLSRGGW